MIINRYLATNLFLIIIIYLCGINVSAQNQTILIFDPHQVSSNFQNSFHQLSSDSIYIADSLDENINNFDALFLFIGYPFVLSEEEGNRLIEYLNLNKPIYLYSELLIQDIEQVTFWNYVGINGYALLTLTVPVDSVVGIDAAFANGVIIDTIFISPGIPGIEGNMVPILDGMWGENPGLQTSFIPGNDSLKVIVDLYYLIYHLEYLEKVLIHFGLEKPNSILDGNANQPNAFYLHQNYPNPFNPSTSIQYAVSSLPSGQAGRQFVSLKVYDVLGSEIATLINEEKPAGIYEILFDASTLSSGVYFYRLQAGDFVETKKMVLLR
jgi:hypothetical protein